MKKTATKGEKSLACLTFLVSLVALVAVAPVSSQAATGRTNAWLAIAPNSSVCVEPAAPAIAPSYLETRDRVSGKLWPARDQAASELSRDLQLGYDESSGREMAGSLDAPRKGVYRPGDVLPDGRIAGQGPGAAHISDPGFASTPSRKFVTYIAEDLDNPGRFYVGRTSGPGDLSIARILQKRRAGHHRNLGPLRLDRVTTSYKAIRGREHLVRRRLRELGLDTDQINPIGPRNKNRDLYLRRALEEFGD